MLIYSKLGGGKIFGVDLIRSVAIFSVIAGHFFMYNSDFNRTPFDGSISMYIQGMLFFFFQIGVPLFIITTGFLNYKKKKLDMKYAKGCMRVVTAYIFFCTLTWAFRVGYQGQTISVFEAIKGILDFHGIILYGWYIEMWIGLYFITPFLNIAYDAIETKSQKQLMIIILFILTSVPEFLNRYNLHLFPGYWVTIYPVMFFVIGRYIKEYRPYITTWRLLPLIIMPCMINPTIGIVRNTGNILNQFAGSCYGVFGTIVAVAMFLLLYKVESSAKTIKFVVGRVAYLSLDIYLCCYMVDQFVYPLLMERFFVTQQQFGIIWWLPTTLIVLIISTMISECKELLFRIIKITK